MIGRRACGVALLLALAGCERETPRVRVEGGDAAAGAALIQSYGCGACHTISGIPFARGEVGPPLRDFSAQVYIAGVLPNMPERLIAWLVDPQAIDPRTAMPNLGLDAAQARDIAAYLYTVE